MNRRRFFAALAGLPLAPIALKAKPAPVDLRFGPLPKNTIDAARKRALEWANQPRTLPGPWPPELLDGLRRDLAEAHRMEMDRARALMQTIEWT